MLVANPQIHNMKVLIKVYSILNKYFLPYTLLVMVTCTFSNTQHLRIILSFILNCERRGKRWTDKRFTNLDVPVLFKQHGRLIWFIAEVI